MHGHIRERKEIPYYVKLFDIALLLCRGIQMSIHDWRAIVVKWLFMPFS